MEGVETGAKAKLEAKAEAESGVEAEVETEAEVEAEVGVVAAVPAYGVCGEADGVMAVAEAAVGRVRRDKEAAVAMRVTLRRWCGERRSTGMATPAIRGLGGVRISFTGRFSVLH
ncbi:hypothetical protein [Streptomyces sp. S186]|uniref:hypothetical protein n=1 Tax=Streptomyces sp. S186 TaxID=3434395 RepID=UPI003F66EF63